MKRILVLISISCGLGLASWGVGGCGSGSRTTTPDGFPLISGGYNLKGDLAESCAPLFGENIECDIQQSLSDSSSLEVTCITADTLEIIATLPGTVDKDANIAFAGTTEEGTTVDCVTTAVTEGSAKNDITLPLTCTLGDNACEVVYGNLF